MIPQHANVLQIQTLCHMVMLMIHQVGEEFSLEISIDDLRQNGSQVKIHSIKYRNRSNGILIHNNSFL